MTISREEINFRRLLKSCDQFVDDIINAHAGESTEIVDFTSTTSHFNINKFTSNIKHLLNLYSTLEKQNELPPDVLADFKQRIRLLESLVDEKRIASYNSTSYTNVYNTASNNQDFSGLDYTEKLDQADRILKVNQIAQLEMRNELLGECSSTSSSPTRRSPIARSSTPPIPLLTRPKSSSSLLLVASGLNARNRKNRLELLQQQSESDLGEGDGDGPDSETQQKILVDNQKIQDELSGELAKMATSLKSNATMFTELLKKDREIIGEAETQLETNISRIKREAEKLTALNLSTRSGTCRLIVMIIVVMMVFMFMVFFMKLFSVK